MRDYWAGFPFGPLFMAKGEMHELSLTLSVGNVRPIFCPQIISFAYGLSVVGYTEKVF
jgi:hypothetical protein